MAGNLVVTIARGYGSGGKTMGITLARDLGWPYYDRDLLRLASDESGINEALFAQADEVARRSLLKARSNALDGAMLVPINNIQDNAWLQKGTDEENKAAEAVFNNIKFIQFEKLGQTHIRLRRGMESEITRIDNGKVQTRLLRLIVILLLIAVAGALLTYFVKTTVVPWLQDKQLYAKVKQAVRCCEQLAKNGMLQELLGCPVDGNAKKNYVIKFLERCGIEITEEVDAMIESAVYDLDHAAKEVVEGFLVGNGEEETTE